MDPDGVISVMKHGLTTGGLVMAPILLTGLVIGITVAAIQAATQVNEPTLTFVPKVLGVGLVGGLVLPWALDRMVLLVEYVMEFAATAGVH
jgi:flagellar biosynthetic protein FliQ